MKIEVVLNFISSQKDSLDDAIRIAAATYFRDNKNKPNFDFDVNECNRESLNLSQGKDLCYDRPGIGFSYALWYHGRRVNTFIRYFADVLLKSLNSSPKKSIEIFDLGAGTGAVQWAVGLVYVSFLKNGIKPPDFKIINVDTSPFMLEFNKVYLWPAFLQKFPEASQLSAEYSVNSWINTTYTKLSNPWIAASYLFDHTENKEEIKKDFLALTEKFQPQKILLLTSNQSEKRSYLNWIATALTGKGYLPQDIESEMLFTGIMMRTHYARQKIQEVSGVTFPRTPLWDDRSIYGLVLSSQNPRIEFDLFQEKDLGIDLYTRPITVRHEIELSKQQKDASKNDGRPSIIVGPAGCGKSVVLTERIRDLVRSYNYSPSLKILVTTFNKQLTTTLGNWIFDILDKKQVIRQGELNPDFYFNGASIPSIRLMHFDILPTRIATIRDDLKFDDYHEDLLNTITNKGFEKIKKERPKVFFLEPQFLFEEYHRVRYGLRVNNWEEYDTIERKGRKKPLTENQRKLVRAILSAYEKTIQTKRISSVISRRRELLKQIEGGSFKGTFSHIFVDEFQDCTQADYAIFYGLLTDPNNLVIAGDYAQAVHIGKSADAPRDDEARGVRMRNFKWHRLEGSYRLPYRISECIKPISRRIKLQDHDQADIITPYKGSPPGARPVIIYGETIELIAEKVLQVVDAYKGFDVIDLSINPKHRITILEKDKELEQKLNNVRSGIAETDTILRLKGLEKRCIFWSTRIGINQMDEVNNYVYTILTRTSGLLLIGLFNDTPDYYKAIVKELDRDRIILWDHASKIYFEKNFCT